MCPVDFLHKNLKNRIFLFLNYDMLNMEIKEQRQEVIQLDTTWKDTETQAGPIEPGNVLLVLSDACAYYFDSLFMFQKILKMESRWSISGMPILESVRTVIWS